MRREHFLKDLVTFNSAGSLRYVQKTMADSKHAIAKFKDEPFVVFSYLLVFVWSFSRLGFSSLSSPLLFVATAQTQTRTPMLTAMTPTTPQAPPRNLDSMAT